MYFWIAFPLLRITLSFAAGIFLAIAHPPSISKLSIVSGSVILYVGYFSVWLLYRRSRFYDLNLIFGTIGHLLIATLGYMALLFQNDRHNPQHLLHKQDVSAYEVNVIDEVDNGKKRIRVTGKLMAVKDPTGWKSSTGKIFIYVKKEKDIPQITYGDVLLIRGSPNPIQPPKNPGAFDYQQYLSYKNIYHQDFIAVDDFMTVEKEKGFFLYTLAIKSRVFLKKILRKHIQRDREYAIALALLIGAKDELTPEINTAYSSAGVMHVLAVSGLHVGIIYVLMLFIFKKIQGSRLAKWMFLTTTLGGLWGYALITGLSASVLRAVAMFSLVTLAKISNRKSSIYNTLSAAGLVLLCYDPYLIMSLGFQLSFLAVFGIIHMTPKIYQLVVVNQSFLDKIWQITCVSIAAQISTLPLVLFYFHQFPTYFFLSNLIVVPAAFAILTSGIALFVFEITLHAGNVVGFLLEQLIYWTNEFVFFIESFSYNTIDNLYINTAQSWLIISGIILLFTYLHYKKSYQFVMLFLVTSLFIAIREHRMAQNLQKKEIVFYSITGHFAIDFIQGNRAMLVASDTLSKDMAKVQFHIKPKRLMAGIDFPIDTSSNIDMARTKVGENELIVWNGRKILILRKRPVFLDNLQVDALFITNNCISNLRQLTAINCRIIIINGFNSRFYIDALTKQAQVEHYHFIDLAKHGAHTITL